MQAGKRVLTKPMLDHRAKQLVRNARSYMHAHTQTSFSESVHNMYGQRRTNEIIWGKMMKLCFMGQLSFKVSKKQGRLK